VSGSLVICNGITRYLLCANGPIGYDCSPSPQVIGDSPLQQHSVYRLPVIWSQDNASFVVI